MLGTRSSVQQGSGGRPKPIVGALTPVLIPAYGVGQRPSKTDPARAVGGKAGRGKFLFSRHRHKAMALREVFACPPRSAASSLSRGGGEGEGRRVKE